MQQQDNTAHYTRNCNQERLIVDETKDIIIVGSHNELGLANNGHVGVSGDSNQIVFSGTGVLIVHGNNNRILATHNSVRIDLRGDSNDLEIRGTTQSIGNYGQNNVTNGTENQNSTARSSGSSTLVSEGKPVTGGRRRQPLSIGKILSLIDRRKRKIPQSKDSRRTRRKSKVVNPRRKREIIPKVLDQQRKRENETKYALHNTRRK